MRNRRFPKIRDVPAPFARSVSSDSGEEKTDQYIWRTAGDGDVRPEHAAREGQVFDWSNPPKGGHPGEDYGCRCVAEALEKTDQKPTGLKQEVIGSVQGVSRKWDEEDFIDHFYNGKGETITLSQTGYLGKIIKKAREVMFHKVENQVADKMREIQNGELIYTTERGYSRLSEVFWVFGGGTIRSRTEGVVVDQGDILSIEAIIYYEYDDTFTDPGSIREKEWIYGTSDPDVAPDWVVKATDGFGTYFSIKDNWQTRMTGIISKTR